MADGVYQNVKVLVVDLAKSALVHLAMTSSPPYLSWLTQVLDRHFPLALIGDPYGLFDLLLKPQVLIHVVLPSQSLPVSPDFVSLGKLFRPLRIR